VTRLAGGVGRKVEMDLAFPFEIENERHLLHGVSGLPDT
jgi:hypothetical protein